MDFYTISVKERNSSRRAILMVIGDYRDYYQGRARDKFMSDLKDELSYPEAYDLRTIRTHDNMARPMPMDLDRPQIVRLENLEEDFAARIR